MEHLRYIPIALLSSVSATILPFVLRGDTHAPLTQAMRGLNYKGMTVAPTITIDFTLDHSKMVSRQQHQLASDYARLAAACGISRPR